MLAVLGALCLVAVAVLVRSALAGDDAGASSDGGDGSTPVVACSPSLAELCDALAESGAIAADPPTLSLADASAPPDDVDAWIAWDPGPAVAGFDADATDPTSVWDGAQPVASAPLAIAGRPDAWADCRPLTWACLAELGADGTPTSVGAPTTDEGLARIAPLAVAATDADTNLLPGPLPDLVAGPTGGQKPAVESAEALATRPGEVAIVVGPAPLLEAVASSAQGESRGLDTATPDARATATVVAASRTGDVDLGALCEAISDEGDEAVAEALESIGVTAGCEGDPMDETRAGFLFQVKEKA